MKRFAIISTSRADWNSLGMVADAMRGEPELHLDIIATNHPGVDVIRGEGWHPRMVSTLEGPRECKAGIITDVVGGILRKFRSECAIILGDRWDALAAALGAAMAGVPIAHLAGGDTTLGSLDDGYRHAISHLARWHFPTHIGALGHLIAMGIPGERVWCVGSPAVDRIKQRKPIHASELFAAIGLAHCTDYCILNWQPETARATPNAGLTAILTALDTYRGGILVVGQNDDVGSEDATAEIYAWAKPRANVSIVQNLAPHIYLAALREAQFLIGNSSSGFYEAPVLGTHVINVGRRQQGRPLSPAITNVPDWTNLPGIIDHVLKYRRYVGYEHPFGDGTASKQIVSILKSL